MSLCPSSPGRSCSRRAADPIRPGRVSFFLPLVCARRVRSLGGVALFRPIAAAFRTCLAPRGICFPAPGQGRPSFLNATASQTLRTRCTGFAKPGAPGYVRAVDETAKGLLFPVLRPCAAPRGQFGSRLLNGSKPLPCVLAAFHGGLSCTRARADAVSCGGRVPGAHGVHLEALRVECA